MKKECNVKNKKKGASLEMTNIKHWEDHSRQMVVSHYKQQNDLVT